jgi:hypothetical protein
MSQGGNGELVELVSTEVLPTTAAGLEAHQEEIHFHIESRVTEATEQFDAHVDARTTDLVSRVGGMIREAVEAGATLDATAAKVTQRVEDLTEQTKGFQAVAADLLQTGQDIEHRVSRATTVANALGVRTDKSLGRIAEQTDYALTSITGRTTDSLGRIDHSTDRAVAEVVSRAQAEVTENAAAAVREVAFTALVQVVHKARQSDQPESKQLVRNLDRLTRQHHGHEPLVQACYDAQVPAWVYGPAGTGKSRVIVNLHTDHDQPISVLPGRPKMSPSLVEGFRTGGTGDYVRTGFRERWEHGGGFLFDEIDLSSSEAAGVMNFAIAGDLYEFPDGELVPRHPDFRAFATANTAGLGADHRYTGRNVIDGAIRDRYAFVPYPEDDIMTEALMTNAVIEPDYIDITAGREIDPLEWNRVRKSYSAASDQLRFPVISPRASLLGKALIEVGMGEEWLKELLIYKGLNERQRRELDDTALEYRRGY